MWWFQRCRAIRRNTSLTMPSFNLPNSGLIITRELQRRLLVEWLEKCNKRFQRLSKIISEQKAKEHTEDVEQHQEKIKCRAKTPGGICNESWQEICCKSVSNTVLSLNFNYSQERNEVKTAKHVLSHWTQRWPPKQFAGWPGKQSGTQNPVGSLVNNITTKYTSKLYQHSLQLSWRWGRELKCKVRKCARYVFSQSIQLTFNQQKPSLMDVKRRLSDVDGLKKCL